MSTSKIANTTLTTARLTLRGARASDLDDLFAIFSNADAMRYWSTPPHPDTSVTQERLDRMIKRFKTHPTYFSLVYQGRVIGTAGLVPPNEVGFILNPAFHRLGLMTEAMHAILAHVWATTDIPQVIADADPRNDASIGILTSLGFTQTHSAKNTFCIAGDWVDSIYFALNRP